MLKWKFWERSAPVLIDVKELFSRFELSGSRFVPDRTMHMPALEAVGQHGTMKAANSYELARAFFADPGKMVAIRTAQSEYSAEHDDYRDRHVKSSACIGYTEVPYSFGQRGFALIIRKAVNTADQIPNAVIFAMYGIYDDQGQMLIKKLMVPFKDDANRLTEVRDIPVTPPNVKGALYYAELCAKALYSGQSFFPRNFMEQALQENVETVGVKTFSPR